MKDTILDMPDLCAANAMMLNTIVEYYKILVHLGSTVDKIGENNIEFTVGEEKRTLDVDTVITSIGYISNRSLYETIKENDIKTHIIGDANKVTNLVGAI